MDLSLSVEQDQLVETFRAFLAKASPSAVVRTAEEEHGGFDRDLWDAVAAMGGPTMGIDAAAGGGGATLLDLELVAECFGAALAPIPAVDGWVTARLLAASGAPARAALAQLVSETPPVAALALHPTTDGAARLVPAGAVASLLVGLDGEELVLVDGEPPAQAVRTLGGAPVADRSLRRGTRTVLATGREAHIGHGRAVDEWRVLTAGALVGLAGAALELGVDYAKERQQFGVPIGSFQALAHQLADVATEVDGARLLAREAAWAADEGAADDAALGRMAFLFAARAAQETSAVALHVHGGYGFTLEYDIQLYLRRAKAWPLLMGDPRRETARLADALFGPAGSADRSEAS